MDEPCSALDPISTGVIEQLIGELRRDLAVVIVTHNLAQAHRVADKVAFMYLGDLVEYGTTAQVFDEPRASRTRTAAALGLGGGFFLPASAAGPAIATALSSPLSTAAM